MRFLLLALLFSPQVQRPEKCSVSGTVVDGITGEPLHKVDIRLEPVDGKLTHIAITVSDAKGQFALVDLLPAAYRLVPRRNGYLETATRVQLDAAQSVSGLKLKLTPSGVIAGMVRDSDGEPLEGAHVALVRRAFANGRPGLEVEAGTETDDRGEYRLRGLAAGRYYIGVDASAHGWDLVDHSATASAERTVPAFYPGVTELSQAAPIEIRAGRHVSGIDVKLPRVRVYSVSGRVLNAGAGRIAVTLRDAANGGLRDYDLRTTTRNAEGDFEFRGIAPGTYELTARTGALNGRAEVVVGSADVDGARLTLAAGAEVQLRISAGPDEEPDLSEIHYFLRADSGSGFGDTPWQTERFKMRNVTPGHYRLSFGGGLLQRYYVKSAHSGELDVLTEGLTVGGPANLLIEAMLASDGAAIKGMVQDTDDQPRAGATVLLAPERRSRADLFRSTTADQNGRYEFTAVPPGAYKVFAWESVEDDAWNDPEFLDSYEKQGQKAVLEPKGRGVVNVRVAVKPDRR